MTGKLFEIHDKGTIISVLAVRLLPQNERERLIMQTAGYGSDIVYQGSQVMLINLSDQSSESRAIINPIDHEGGRTMHHAHVHIMANFDYLYSGSVIDVRYLLGEIESPFESKLS